MQKIKVSFPFALFSLQKIIHRNDGTESECTERDGWCLAKTSDDLRDSMSLMIKQIIRSTRPGKDALNMRVLYLALRQRCSCILCVFFGWELRLLACSGSVGWIGDGWELRELRFSISSSQYQKPFSF